MADVTVKRVEDFETYYLGSMKKARSGLGVSSFGMQVLDLPANESRYPDHDHADSGQEEVYVVLEGAATLQVAGDEHRLEPGVFARVGPGETRKIVTGDEPARILALGGTPGKAFEAVAMTDEGEPDPLAG